MVSYRYLFNGITTVINTLYIRYIQCIQGGVNIGTNLRLCGRMKFRLARGSTFNIGNDSVITGGFFTNTLGCLRGSCISVDRNAILEIGCNTGMSDVSIRVEVCVIIGDNVTIGAETIISDSNAHSLNYLNRRLERQHGDKSDISRAPVIIEDDVFIGARCIIGKGITIGARSIIAAGSVVKDDIPPDEIWGGNPARFIKKIVYEE